MAINHNRILTPTKRKHIYTSLHNLAMIAQEKNESVYGFEGCQIRSDLEHLYSFRLVQFKERGPSSTSYIVDLSRDEQILFILFVAEFIRTDGMILKIPE